MIDSVSEEESMQIIPLVSVIVPDGEFRHGYWTNYGVFMEEIPLEKTLKKCMGNARRFVHLR